MAWFMNHYECERCGKRWSDDWSCMCDDDCPYCGARHMSPYESTDLTEIIEPQSDEFVVFRSPKTAGHTPDYVEVARFLTKAEAMAFINNGLGDASVSVM